MFSQIPKGLSDDEVIAWCKTNMTPDVSEHLAATPDNFDTVVFEYVADADFSTVEVYLDRSQFVDEKEIGSISVEVHRGSFSKEELAAFTSDYPSSASSEKPLADEAIPALLEPAIQEALAAGYGSCTFIGNPKLDAMLPLISSSGPPQKAGSTVKATVIIPGHLGDIKAVIRTF